MNPERAKFNQEYLLNSEILVIVHHMIEQKYKEQEKEAVKQSRLRLASDEAPEPPELADLRDVKESEAISNLPESISSPPEGEQGVIFSSKEALPHKETTLHTEPSNRAVATSKIPSEDESLSTNEPMTEEDYSEVFTDTDLGESNSLMSNDPSFVVDSPYHGYRSSMKQKASPITTPRKQKSGLFGYILRKARIWKTKSVQSNEDKAEDMKMSDQLIGSQPIKYTGEITTVPVRKKTNLESSSCTCKPLQGPQGRASLDNSNTEKDDIGINTLPLVHVHLDGNEEIQILDLSQSSDQSDEVLDARNLSDKALLMKKSSNFSKTDKRCSDWSLANSLNLGEPVTQAASFNDITRQSEAKKTMSKKRWSCSAQIDVTPSPSTSKRKQKRSKKQKNEESLDDGDEALLVEYVHSMGDLRADEFKGSLPIDNRRLSAVEITQVVNSLEILNLQDNEKLSVNILADQIYRGLVNVEEIGTIQNSGSIRNNLTIPEYDYDAEIEALLNPSLSNLTLNCPTYNSSISDYSDPPELSDKPRKPIIHTISDFDIALATGENSPIAESHSVSLLDETSERHGKRGGIFTTLAAYLSRIPQTLKSASPRKRRKRHQQTT